MNFAKNFLWGSATASYQIEGGIEARGYTVWDDFCTRKGAILDGSNGNVACDHYHLYKEDVQLMKELGFQAYRFSIAWSRILPEGIGKINPEGIKFYNDLINQLIKNDIEPCITLFHWDLPYALYCKGGWQNPEIVEWFAEYAKIIAEYFGDRVKIYITFNEPQCFVGLGHVTGEHAPGNLMSRRSVLQMVHHVLKAHGRAVQEIRKKVQHAQIGIAPTSTPACPASEDKDDIEAARKRYFAIDDSDENYMWNVTWWSDPVFLGKYPEEGMKLFEKDLPIITEEDMKLISEPIDFYGQNIYNGYFVRAGDIGSIEYLGRKQGNPRTACGWPVVPESLYWGPKFLYERYKTPIYITENGISCTDTISLDGKIHDSDRIDFLHRYLLQLGKAIQDGVDIRGYFVWSLIDNFEWAKGYTERFGLIHVDYETGVRTKKDSAEWFAEIIRQNGKNLKL